MFVSCECLCCQVEVSATGRSLVQRSPTDCGVWVWSSENKKTHYVYCEQGRRRGKDYETKCCARVWIRFKWLAFSGELFMIRTRTLASVRGKAFFNPLYFIGFFNDCLMCEVKRDVMANKYAFKSFCLFTVMFGTALVSAMPWLRCIQSPSVIKDRQGCPTEIWCNRNPV
jgi:hypothetical protein